MDESASRLRIEIDSMPTELDVVIRRLRQLDIERMALENETDDASKDRRQKLEAEYAQLKEQSDELAARWQAEKQAITKIQVAKQEYEDRRAEGERLERQGDLAGAAAMLLGNALRIVLMVVLGNRGLADSVERFHVSAGWMFFSAAFLVYLAVVYRWMLIRPAQE